MSYDIHLTLVLQVQRGQNSSYIYMYINTHITYMIETMGHQMTKMINTEII